MTRKTRGLTRSVIALIVPPLPAPSRPSKTMQILSPFCLTHSCSLTNSTCSLVNSFSYFLVFSLPLLLGSFVFAVLPVSAIGDLPPHSEMRPIWAINALSSRAAALIRAPQGTTVLHQVPSRSDRMAYAPAYPHDPIEPIAEDVFTVRGSFRMNALVRISRNMAIVRHDGELTLVNPIRLDAAGEAQLRGLGTVARLFRLGSLHGVDDPYYVDTFHAELWS